MSFPTIRSWIALLGFMAATFAAAAIGGTATAGSVREWYPALVKPSWNPPSWVFGPAWTLLYLLMSVAAWRVWQHRTLPGARSALVLFFVQLALNALWSVLFFGLHSPGLALAEIMALWVCLVLVQRSFWRLDRTAGWLWLPYLAWVTFAAGLNCAIVTLNR
jgi:tryptophan-rich sensory protein